MTIRPLKVDAFEITDAPALDPVRVIVQDFGKGQGRIILECYGQAWSCFWSSMGSDVTVRKFFLLCDPDYLATKMANGKLKKQEFAYLMKVVNAVRGAFQKLEDESTQGSHAGVDPAEVH